MIQIKKTILTLVALLALTTQAWAEEKMVTINSGTMSSGAVTATGFINLFDNLIVGVDPATITTSEGVITKLVIKKGTIYEDDFTEANVGVTPGTITYGSDEITVTDINAESVTLSRKGDLNWSPSSVDVYYGAPATGPDVDWNKATKTGTFKMPGGNVELEPEYYPQAVLATGGAPTAINDVPATTDGAIVNAGTVATIGETANAQGTVMYHVSQTALDDAALLALAADAWTADVPTAESFTAAGQAYVYYYVRGNDSDTDDEIFSDGDILSTNALTVTIAAAPTYAVTFAEGTDPKEWTASPNANVTKGQTVTVTYTGSKKVLGVKAEKKAAAELPKYADVVKICDINGDNKYLVSSFFDGTNANITTITKEEAIALAEYLGGGDIRVVYEEYEFSGTRYVRATKAAGDTSGVKLSTTNTSNVPLYYVPAGN